VFEVCMMLLEYVTMEAKALLSEPKKPGAKPYLSLPPVPIPANAVAKEKFGTLCQIFCFTKTGKNASLCQLLKCENCKVAGPSF
jgi:hypothetical protein